MDAVWLGNAPRTRNPTSRSQSKATPVERVLTGRIITGVVT
jgi:hypothetical protein